MCEGMCVRECVCEGVCSACEVCETRVCVKRCSVFTSVYCVQ